MTKLYESQSHFPKSILIKLIAMALFGVIFLYVSAILLTLSLFNIFFFLILLWLFISYIRWIAT